jgi:hypothetical protein
MNRSLALAALALAAAAMARADGSLAVSQLPPAEPATAQQAKDAAALADGSGPARAESLNSGGAGASADLLQAKDAPGFVARNCGKILSGLGVAGGYALVARNNDMWPFRKDSAGGSSAGSSTSSATVTTTQSDRRDANVTVTEKPPFAAERFWPLKKTWYEFRLDPHHPLTLQLGPAEYCQSDRHYETDKGSTPRILAPILASDTFERAFLLHDYICLHHGAFFAETPDGPYTFRPMSSPEPTPCSG